MKRTLKVIGGILLVVALLIAGLVGWLALRKPASHPASTEKIEATPARLARGAYLVEHVSDCLGCHSDHLLTFGLPLKPGTEGQGGFEFDKKLGLPGTVSAQNITSDPETGLGQWTDGEIIRAIREGIDRKGEALFPMMPYPHLRELSDEDVRSIVVYLRTLKPVRNQVVARHIDFPVNLLIKFAPKPVDGPVSAPDPANSVAYGKYLTTIGGCYECHTPHDDKNALIVERAFAGGWEMKGPWGRNVTANLTPHPETFVGRSTKAEFIGRFQAFRGLEHSSIAAPAGKNTVMPWLAFAGMTDQDLGAIYDYLHTVKPIANKVNSFPDAH